MLPPLQEFARFRIPSNLFSYLQLETKIPSAGLFPSKCDEITTVDVKNSNIPMATRKETPLAWVAATPYGTLDYLGTYGNSSSISVLVYNFSNYLWSQIIFSSLLISRTCFLVAKFRFVHVFHNSEKKSKICINFRASTS